MPHVNMAMTSAAGHRRKPWEAGDSPDANCLRWIFLFVAGVLEIVWATGLKFTEGFTKFWPGVVTILAMVASLLLLAQALKTIPVGTGYAVWTGIGAAGTAILGIVLFSESAALPRLACIAAIVAGIVGLKFNS
jgi:quaternary ammonium compound-resistance protein SugE